MRGCNTHYHDTLGLTDSVDTKLISPPARPLRDYKEGLGELIDSIREKGIIQPIVVRPMGDRFEVVAGARRFEACRRLRWSKVPCVIRTLSERDAYEISLVENIQRKTMNPIEEARAFREYINNEGWGGETRLAKKIGKSQEFVSQRLTLLSLPGAVKERIIRHQISASVGQEIVRVPDKGSQITLSKEAASRSLTVVAVRETAKSIRSGESVSSAIHRAEEKIKVVEHGKEALRDMLSDEPSFMSFRGKAETERALELELRDLENATLILKLAMSRLSMLVDVLPEENSVKELLVEKRYHLHEMVDSLIKVKLKMERSSAAVLVYRH